MSNLEIITLLSIIVNIVLSCLFIKYKIIMNKHILNKHLILFHLYMKDYLINLSKDTCSYLHVLNDIGHNHSILNPKLTHICLEIVKNNPQHNVPFPFVTKEK